MPDKYQWQENLKQAQLKNPTNKAKSWSLSNTVFL